MNPVTLHVVTGAIMFAALVISGISDIKTRRVSRVCSYGLLLFSLFLLIYRKEYILSVYFVLAVLTAGNKKLKPILFVMALITFSSEGDCASPMVFGLSAVDFLFSMKLIGGGDAQLLFSMLSFGYNSWKMAFSITAVVIIIGTVSVIYAFGIKESISRLKTVSSCIKNGTVRSDKDRLKIPLASLLPFAFLSEFQLSGLYGIVLNSVGSILRRQRRQPAWPRAHAGRALWKQSA